MSRLSGVLLPVFSLPGQGGIGSLGEEAYRFADFLHESGCHIWQVLPMGPTGYGESPYQSTSTYAGNPLLISLETLKREGLVTFAEEELKTASSPDRIDYESVRTVHERLLHRAFSESYDRLEADIRAFEKSQSWVHDFALFTALKKHFGNAAWQSWPEEGLRLRRPRELAEWEQKLSREIAYEVFVQYLFDRQWERLHAYCRRLDIRLFGDMPIYVAEDSADTWTNPRVFQLDRNRVPKRVAGVPPDYFSADGQLWGNPLYNWTYLRLTGFAWWVQRMTHMAHMYDIVRIDHFIGLANYYSIPYGAKNARIGKWVNAPGKALLKTLKRRLPDLSIIAEDLGCVNDRVRRLIDWSGYPGMRVLVFGFEGESNVHHPSHWVPHCVAYTGTHDNDTVVGFLKRASEEVLAGARATTGMTDLADAAHAFVHTALASCADTVIIPMQDLLGLDNRARMNVPSTIGTNWLWRMQETDLTDALSSWLKDENEKTGRMTE